MTELRKCAGCDAQIEVAPYGRGRERKWCSDRCRKDTTYVRHCPDCGKRLSGSDGNGPNAPIRCLPCHNRSRRIWDRESITDLILAWAKEHGAPPSAADWNPHAAIAMGRPERAERFYRDGCWPTVTTVRHVFGSWNAAIEAAGLTPRGSGSYGRPGESMELCREIRERYEAGESTVALGAAYGCSAVAIKWRVLNAGGRMRTMAAAQALRRAKVS